MSEQDFDQVYWDENPPVVVKDSIYCDDQSLRSRSIDRPESMPLPEKDCSWGNQVAECCQTASRIRGVFICYIGVGACMTSDKQQEYIANFRENYLSELENLRQDVTLVCLPAVGIQTRMEYVGIGY